MENDVLYNRIMNVVHEEYGEGSTAVANPEGEPTGDLTSIQIGDEIYGISGGGGGTDRFVEVQFDVNTLTLDKTWQQIFDLIEDGKIPFFIVSSDDPDYSYASRYQCDVANQQENVFSVYFYNCIFSDGGGVVHAMPFLTNSANGYPVLDE